VFDLIPAPTSAGKFSRGEGAKTLMIVITNCRRRKILHDLIPAPTSAGKFSRGEGAKTSRMIFLPLLWRGLG